MNSPYVEIIRKQHIANVAKVNKKTLKHIKNRIKELWPKVLEVQPYLTGFGMGMGMWYFNGKALYYYADNYYERITCPNEDYSDYQDDTHDLCDKEIPTDTELFPIPYNNPELREVIELLDFVLRETDENLSFEDLGKF